LAQEKGLLQAANSQRIWPALKAADKGTLFLDEIGLNLSLCWPGMKSVTVLQTR